MITNPDQLQMLSVTGLLPCPFCRSVQLSHISIRATEDQPKRPLCVQCDTCGASGPMAASEDQQRALWGVRVEDRES